MLAAGRAAAGRVSARTTACCRTAPLVRRVPAAAGVLLVSRRSSSSWISAGSSRSAAAGFGGQAEILFLISPFERAERRQTAGTGRLGAKTFRLGCAPIVNLFPQTAEPILLDHTRVRVPGRSGLRRRSAMEIFSVDEVVSVNPQSSEVVHYEPFYSYRHGASRDKKQTFWHATRRASGRRDDEGTDVYSRWWTFPGGRCSPNVDALTVRTTCTNRDLPSGCPSATRPATSSWKARRPSSGSWRCSKPTDTLRPPVGKDAAVAADLAAVAQLSFAGGEGREALQEILRLYNFTELHLLGEADRRHPRLDSRRHFARVISENGVVFARGTQVEMEFDEEQFVGGGVYLFAAVLECFLGLYVSMNSFSQLGRHGRGRGRRFSNSGHRGPDRRSCCSALAEHREPARTRSPICSSSSRRCGCWSASSPSAQPVGRFVNPPHEVVRFGANPTLSFPGQRDPVARAARQDGAAADARELHGADRPAGRAAAVLHRAGDGARSRRATRRCGISSTSSTTASSRCSTRPGRSTVSRSPTSAASATVSRTTCWT